MLRTIKRSIASLIFLIASVGSAGSAAELVTNGGFESPTVTGGGYDYATGAGLPGWTIFAPNNGIVLFDSSYRPVGDGLQSIQLEYPDDYIEQTITTVAGRNYVLSFLLSAYDALGGILEVEIDGGAVPLSPASPYAGTSASYLSHSIVFTAAGPSTLLHFENGGALFTYPHLDNVSVVLPEPASLALIGLGLVGLAFARRKR